MRAWLQYGWYNLSASLWFVPILMMGGALVLSFLTLYVDTRFDISLLAVPGSDFHVGPEGSRLLLQSIASSMITVASLVFSITLVALQLASSQLGPRLINRFMHDKVNQVVLGTFIATFLYALMVLRTVTGQGEQSFVPHLSTLVALLLTLASLIWLVYFIHHLAESIQADTVIADVSAELHHVIARMFPGTHLHKGNLPAAAMPPLDLVAEPAGEIRFRRTGYIQAIDTHALLKIARARELIMDLHRRPGHFVVAGTGAVAIWPREAVSEKLTGDVLDAIVIGYRRTPTQDIEFVIGSLVQIGLRALSPALNDPITAMTCVDRLSGALAELMRRPPPPSLIPDESGEVRLILYPTSFEGALDAAFNDIRQAAGGQVRVLIRLAEAFTMLAAFAHTEEQRRAVERHADMLTRLCRDIEEPRDAADAEACLKRLWSTLARDPRVEPAPEG
jgi:uncharacterized membrane protein